MRWSAWLGRLLPRVAVQRRAVVTHRSRGYQETAERVALHLHFDRGGAATARRPTAREERRTPIMDALFGPKVRPLSDMEARRMPVQPDPARRAALARREVLAEGQGLTGAAYPGRQQIVAARAEQAARAATVERLARTMGPRVAATPPRRGRGPIKVAAYVKGDGTRVRAYRRARSGQGGHG